MNAWLMWLEPWNVSHTSKAQNATKRIISTVSGARAQGPSSPSLTVPSADRKSSYTKDWQPFLAANLFLYTVPLAIFLRRARELDFSSGQMNRSMRVVKRVFRVFTPEVVQALSTLTDSVQLSAFHAPGLGTWKGVDKHLETLGDYAPSLSGDLRLHSCQEDVKGLLEEVQMQHLKRVRDFGAFGKLAAFLEGLCGHGMVSGEEMAIQSLVEQARVIVELPIDYEIFPPDQTKTSTVMSSSGATESFTTALRTPQGALTDEGRKQLLEGRYKCSPTDVTFIGDRMQGRVQTHEIAFLVSLTNFLSNWLNMKLGLLPTEGSDSGLFTMWRINLRFLADYRNLFVTLLCTGFLWMWKGW